jgi:hypothetical protein
MTLLIKAKIEQASSNEYFATVIDNEKFKGIVVQASSEEEAAKELLTSIKVKMAYDYGIAIESIQEDDGIDNSTKLHDSKNIDLILQ